MTADREEQEDELLALHSIFDSDEFFRHESKFAGEIRASVELPADFTVVLKEGETQRQYEISFLPPLCLTFELPEDYPSSSPPSFTLTCSWLTHSQLSALTAQLTDLYQDTGGTVVLFTWIQFLKEDALKFLDIHSLLELPSDEQNNESDVSASSSGDEHLTGNPDNSQNPAPSDQSSKDSLEAVKLGQNNSTSHDSKLSQNELNSDSNEETLIQKHSADSDQISSNEREADQTSELKAFSEHVSSAQSDLNNQEENFNGDDASASVSPTSSSPKPLDSSGQSEFASPPATNPSGLCLTPSQALLSQLLIHNAAQKQKEFNTTVFDCDICFVGWLGSECIQLLECGHIFCQGCLGEFCKLQITEGNVKGVTCPNADCSATPTPAQVRSLVGEELFSRYDRLLLQMTLDSMPDVVYCPRRTCAAAVIREKSSRAAVCSVCRYAFCVACKKTYHGTKNCQKEGKTKTKTDETEQPGVALPRTEEGIKALWEDYSKGSKERKKLLERRYGRSRMLFTLEEGLSEQWIVVNSKNCPHCFCKIEKNGGCNIMSCSRCNQQFCWRCLTRLPTRYGSHFSESPDCMIPV
ncbi:E3 ubiquitin-protein ligase RNF14-like [Cheilinus undulatus]|uniref:E3 ubiquitin-protein ligase RNF14-like n=1 Tax=Cheilinus undulatus TaxID=241271 RepID=UPI001BD37D05|nr:E3 ubiquitin-protein ligase RNF14-like [Cheilinus undulatus]